MFTGKKDTDYQKVLIALQPPGDIWNTDPDSSWGKMLLGFAKEFERFDQRGYDMISESIFSRISEMLEEYEHEYDLPDEGYDLPSTTAERISLIQSKAKEIGRLDASFFVELAAELGYTVTITQHQPAWCGYVVTGDTCGTQNNIFFFHVYVNFQHGDDINLNITNLIAQVNRRKPAHMIALFDWLGPGFSRGFSRGFDSKPSNDNSFYPGGFGPGFSSGFQNNYTYDGVYLTGGFNAGFSIGFNNHPGGGFARDGFSAGFRRPS